MKTHNLKIICVTIFCVLMIIGCSRSENRNSPDVTATPTIQYFSTNEYNSNFAHFSTPKESKFQLTFDYPVDWLYNFDDTNPNLLLLFLFDPEKKYIPSQEPNTTQIGFSDYGRVYIWIEALAETMSLNSKYNDHLDGCKNGYSSTLLNEYQITLDDVEAKVIECQLAPYDDTGFSSIMLEKSIFFESNYIFYEITLQIPENERQGKFVEGFKLMLSTLNVNDVN